jgi:hypothetical protein
MTERTWRGKPLYTSADGKFSTTNEALVEPYDRAHAPAQPSRLLKPANDEQTAQDAEGVTGDGATDPDENDGDEQRVADGRGDGDVHGGGHGEQVAVRPDRKRARDRA